jgi:hygromycin-B 7''-O-kinase
MILPTAPDDAGWDALLADESALAGGVSALLDRHGLADEPRQRYDSGSLPVYAVGPRHVLKLFPPSEHQHAAVEARVLAAVQGALPIPTPQLIAADSHDGWSYLLMSQLRGQRLVDAWPALTLSERDGIADTLGEAIAALHAIDTAPLAGLPPRWDDFIAAQRDSAAERQSKRRLDAYWLERVPEFLQRWMPPPAARHVLLHTEIMREHLMLDRDGAASPHLAGLFDFEPAMLGAAEYEFASVGLFVACGDARTLRRVLLAYGYAPHALDEALQCRFMAYALLHRYSNLRWYLERLPAGDAMTLEQLASRWWPLH